MVKKFAIVLSLFLLGLSIAPCVDGVGIASQNFEISNKPGPDHDHSANDLCSPLCSCNCCQTHLLVHHLFMYSLDVVPVSTRIPSLINPLTDGFQGSILQPPKA